MSKSGKYSRTSAKGKFSDSFEMLESRQLMSATQDISTLEKNLSSGCGCGCSGGKCGATRSLFSFSSSASAMTEPSVEWTNPYLGYTFTDTGLNSSLWSGLTSVTKNNPNAKTIIRPQSFLPLSLNASELLAKLPAAKTDVTESGSGAEAFSSGLEKSIIELPDPSGTLRAFEVWDSGTLSPGLQEQFGNIRALAGRAVNDPLTSLALEYTEQGLTAQVFSPGGSFYINPVFHLDTTSYMSYWRKDLADMHTFTCLCGSMADATPEDLAALEAPPEESSSFGESGGGTAALLGDTLRIYDLAVSATGEYTAFHGGTVTGALSAITTVVNRLNTIYERDLAVRFQLIANNNLLIYTSASTDPFTAPNDAVTTITENQTTVDTVIGNANYDVGHVFHRGSGGGIAGAIGNVGVTGQKAQGYSSLSSPVGDPFSVDYVAHELGHQFGGRHTFNNCGGSQGDSSSLAVEPGSGSTIMAYAGICGSTTNLQNNSDPFFHSINISQIRTYIQSTTPNNAATRITTGNAIPVVEAGLSYTIPARTPFVLTGSATDANPTDVLTYSWEQRNGGSVITLGDGGQTTGPLFRTLNPSTSPTRFFPAYNTVRGLTPIKGETLPTVARTLNFTLLVRDNRAGNGATADDTTTVIINNNAAVGTTGFDFTNFNTATTVSGGSSQTLNWNVAGTTANGINVSTVTIDLSLDGGITFPHMLAAGTPNDGSQAVQIPFDISSSQARFRIRADGNIFYNLNNANFTITLASAVGTTPGAVTLASASDTGQSSTDRVTRFNNSNVSNRLSFSVAGTVNGATVELLSGGQVIGSAVASGTTTVVQTNGTVTLAEGVNNIAARQALPSQTVSALGPALSVTIDSLAPVITPTTDFSVVSLSSLGMPVTYDDATVTDATAVILDYSLPSGAFFNLGPTGVNLNVTDLAGNTAADNFIVTLEIPSFLTLSGGAGYELTGLTPGSTLTLSGSGSSFIADPDTAGYDLLNVTLAPGASLNVSSGVQLGTLDVPATSSVTLVSGAADLAATQLLIAGTLNTNDNDILVEYSGPDPLLSLISAINAGQIVPASAANWLGSDFGTTLGLANAEDFITTFLGRPVAFPAVWGHFTWLGDLNLDGQVNSFDYPAIDDNFGFSGVSFASGDANYDGVVNSFDYSNIDDTFGAGVGGSRPPGIAPTPTLAGKSTLFSAKPISSDSLFSDTKKVFA